MQGKNKPSWFGEQLRKFIMGFQLISSLALGIFLLIVFYFAMNYLVDPTFTAEQIEGAKKIGNWEFPDNNYILRGFENISVGNKIIGMATVKDKQNGNLVMVFDISFTQAEVLKIKDLIKNQILEKYGLGKPYPRSSEGRIGPIGEEFIYTLVGWGSGDSAQSGLIGNLDCLGNRERGSFIMAVAYNKFVKFDSNRALSFINTLNCPAGTGKGGSGNDVNVGRVDTDGDGMSDKVEKMLGTDPYKADTDGDGFNDFEEVENGRNPMVPRPWDEYTPEEFAKVKKDIKYISTEDYNKLFGVK